MYCVPHFASGIYTEAFHEEENMKRGQDTRRPPWHLVATPAKSVSGAGIDSCYPRHPRAMTCWAAGTASGWRCPEGGGSGPTLR